MMSRIATSQKGSCVFARHVLLIVIWICPILSAMCALPSALQNESPHRAELPDKVKAQRWRILRITVRDKEGFRFQGTGFALLREKKCFAITNLHVINQIRARFGDDAEIWVDFHEPINAHQAWTVDTDAANDLAVLKTDVEINAAPGQEFVDGAVGMAVFILGYDDEHLEKSSLLMQQRIVVFTARWVEEMT